MGKYDFKTAEEHVLKLWKDSQIYQKQKKMKKKGAKTFYFLQGPPYTNGKFALHHAWNNALKDMVIRYHKMKGEDVWDRAGWDMHGLPIERVVMKELDVKEKKDIDNYLHN